LNRFWHRFFVDICGYVGRTRLPHKTGRATEAERFSSYKEVLSRTSSILVALGGMALVELDKFFSLL
jgi:hypothetical protein